MSFLDCDDVYAEQDADYALALMEDNPLYWEEDWDDYPDYP